MPYKIQVSKIGTDEWKKSSPSTKAAGFWPDQAGGFTLLGDATKCAAEYATRIKRNWQVRVVDTNMLVWWESHAVGSDFDPKQDHSLTKEDNMSATPDLTKPMTFKRTVLIELLQVTLDKEVAKRQEAEAEQAKAREEVLTAITDFTPDELYNIFKANWVIDVPALKYAKEQKTWVTQAIKPTQTETDAEKFVRLLGRATDNELEVLPNQSIYQLL